MKKSRLSIALVLAVLAGSAFAMTPHVRLITAGWYGQTQDAPSSYSTSFFIANNSQLNSKCPVSTEHLCAVKLKDDGTLDSPPNTRMSTHNYQQ